MTNKGVVRNDERNKNLYPLQLFSLYIRLISVYFVNRKNKKMTNTTYQLRSKSFIKKLNLFYKPK